MARTFKDINGNTYSLDNLQENYRVEVGVDTDIVTGEPTGYTVILDGE